MRAVHDRREPVRRVRAEREPRNDVRAVVDHVRPRAGGAHRGPPSHAHTDSQKPSKAPKITFISALVAGVTRMLVFDRDRMSRRVRPPEKVAS